MTQDKDDVTVHLVPHTHDDTGWLKTVDQYYSGNNNSIYHAYVKMILTTVVDSLLANPERKFTYVEQAFFKRWWRQQSAERKRDVKSLVARGQLSFANGGWCMHDEATTFYLDMIDQTTLGHRFLMDTFGFSPKAGWQLDPFGHSATQAALLSAEVGFTGLFFGRIDYQDLEKRVNEQSAEFVWRASPSLGDSAQVFSGLTGEYGGNYQPPRDFNWFSDDGELIQDDKSLNDYNVQSRVDDFVKDALSLANKTRGNHVMFTMGQDFTYENAQEYFDEMDKIIKYVNRDGRVKVKYSTPEIYLQSKREQSGVSWPLKVDDFFPYADRPHAFWTGYFTSRPSLKRYVRESSAFLQVMHQIYTAGGADPAGLRKLEEAMALLQHHDAVAGTEKQHVTSDYAQRIAKGRATALESGSAAFQSLFGVDRVVFCNLRNVSVCAPTQGLLPGGRISMVLWNGLAHSRNEIVEVPAPASGSLQITVASSGVRLATQTVPSLPSVTNYGADAGGSNNTVLFRAELPALGYEVFELSQLSSVDEPLEASSGKHAGKVILENEFLSLTFEQGLLMHMLDKESGVQIAAKQEWLYYVGSTGDSKSDQVSGAYLFRPDRPNASSVSDGLHSPSLRVVRGSLADEVHQVFAPWLSQRIRLPKGARHAEVSYTVGPIPEFREVISRITTSIANGGQCYTDSNGREMQFRQRDFRQTWKLNQTESVAGNYFPVTSALSIRDQAAQLTLLTDAPQGGTGCVHDGVLEMMVHRTCAKDDARGVDEPLIETQNWSPSKPHRHGPRLVIRGRHWLSLSAPARAARVWRPLADRLYMPPQPFFFHGTASSNYVSLSASLPSNVQIVTLRTWKKKCKGNRVLLVRLAHQLGIEEDDLLSRPVEIDLRALFPKWRIKRVQERGLSAVISRAEVLKRRVPWPIEHEAHAAAPPLDGEGSSRKVTLGPMQIRTFFVTVQGRGEAMKEHHQDRPSLV